MLGAWAQRGGNYWGSIFFQGWRQPRLQFADQAEHHLGDIQINVKYIYIYTYIDIHGLWIIQDFEAHAKPFFGAVLVLGLGCYSRKVGYPKKGYGKSLQGV